MVKFSAARDLEGWLKDKPKVWAPIIALRSALRVTPILNNAIKKSKINDKLKNNLILDAGRACLVSGVAVKFPSIGSNHAVARAGFAARTVNSLGDYYAASAVVNAVRYSATAAVFAARTAADITYANPNDSYSFTASEATDYSAKAARYSNIALAARASLNHDAQWLLTHQSDDDALQKLINRPLWRDKQNPLDKNWLSLRKNLTTLDPNWQFWIDWYQAILDGTTHSVFTQSQQDEIYLQISEFPNELWEEGSEAVNVRIVKLLEEQKIYHKVFSQNFFLSYSNEDEEVARRVAAIIEEQGYSVFAQFKDMPVGSNFIEEMQNGLANSSHFISLYSSSYKTSDYCQQEWNAAITYDPRGKLRKIIPFLIEHVELLPLARSIIFKSLIGLNEEKFRKAVIDAITLRDPISIAEARTEAKKATSPDAIINENGKLDTSANNEYDKPQLTEDLYRLPDRQIALINTLLAALESKNAPSCLISALKEYRKEFELHGVSASVGSLNDQITLIEIAIEDNETNIWCNNFIFTGINSLLNNHSRIKTHYPLAPIREQFIQDAPLNPAKFDEDAFRQLSNSYQQRLKNLADEKLTTEKFVNYVKVRNNLYKEIENLSSSFFHESDEDAVIKSEKEISVDDLKKRYMIQESGFADKITDLLKKSDKLANSATLKSFAKIAKEIADWIWS